MWCRKWVISLSTKRWRYLGHAGVVKRKAVPPHAMEALGGRGGAWGERRYSSYSFTTSALDGGDFTPGERTPGTHCTGGWVGHRAGLDTEDKGKILCPCRGSNLDRPVVQPVVRHYTDWATPAGVVWGRRLCSAVQSDVQWRTLGTIQWIFVLRKRKVFYGQDEGLSVSRGHCYMKSKTI
jgi:hypothetical protein